MRCLGDGAKYSSKAAARGLATTGGAVGMGGGAPTAVGAGGGGGCGGVRKLAWGGVWRRELGDPLGTSGAITPSSAS